MTAFRSKPVVLGDGYSVEFTFAGGRMDVEWSPDLPAPAAGKPLLPAYVRARNLFLGEVGRCLGVSIAVVDVGGGV